MNLFKSLVLNGFYTFLLLILFPASIYGPLVLSSLIQILASSVLGLPDYMFNMNHVVGITLFLGTVIVVVFTYLINLLAVKVFGFKKTHFIVAISTYCLISTSIQIFSCAISMMISCEVSELFTARAVLLKLLTQYLPLILTYIIAVKRNSSTPLTNFRVITLLTIIIIASTSISLIFSNYEKREVKKPMLLRKTLEGIEWSEYPVKDSGYWIKMPSELVTDFFYFRDYLKLQQEEKPSQHKKLVYNFSHSYIGYFKDNAELHTYAENPLTITVKFSLMKQPNQTQNMLDYINLCGKEVETYIYSKESGMNSYDDSEFCPSKESLKILPNGIVYCETLNNRWQLALKESPHSLVGYNEDKERFFVAKLPGDNQNCVVVSFSAKPNNAKEKNIYYLAEKILTSIKKL